MWLGCIPTGRVEDLAVQIKTMTSQFYNASSPYHALAVLVDPSFDINTVKDTTGIPGSGPPNAASSGGATSDNSRTRENTIIGVVCALGGRPRGYSMCMLRYGTSYPYPRFCPYPTQFRLKVNAVRTRRSGTKSKPKSTPPATVTHNTLLPPSLPSPISAHPLRQLSSSVGRVFSPQPFNIQSVIAPLPTNSRTRPPSLSILSVPQPCVGPDSTSDPEPSLPHPFRVSPPTS